jgi:hypothetical protein
MIAALLLLAVGLADVVIGLFGLRSTAAADGGDRSPDRWDVVGIALALTASSVVAVAGWTVVGIPTAAAVAIVLAAFAWVCAGVRYTVEGKPAALLTFAVLLVGAVAAAQFLTADLAFVGPGVVAYQDAAAVRGWDIPLAAVIGAVAVLTVLLRTSNLVCRAVVGRTLTAERPGEAPVPRRWALALGSRTVGSVAEQPTPAPSVTSPTRLRGGRVIGPLERLLIVALGLVGAQALIVALLAAKGIVRFPEISADNAFGAKAEEFLVGSLSSWSIAGLSLLLLVSLAG